MVSSLVQLENLDVSWCEDLKRVIMVEGVEEEVNTELIFPRLNSISLAECDKLSSFYAGSYALKFQLAIKIKIRDCRNMITFASTFSTEQEKETTYRGTEGHLGKKEPDIRSRTLFYDVVDIPLLDDLDLMRICVQQIWHSQITLMSSSVQNLRKLSVWGCDNLKFLCTSSMVKSLGQLEVLKIWKCKEMQVVILIEELVEKEETSETIFPKLNNLELHDLPQLIRFCSNFNSLGEVYEAQGHNGSGSQVLAATQSNLVETEVTQLVFPQVTYLQLCCLPNFKGFFPQIRITKWPLLKRMLVEQCDKVKTFASEFPSIEEKNGDEQLERQTQDPMFWIGKTLPNLEKLVVSEASFHEIFQCERLHSEGRPVYAPSQLSKLKLSKLMGLMHLWKEESDLKSIFYNLRTLEVLECIKLVNLVPSVVSFVNLQTLEISKCHGLKNLVSYSTAKSLEQLKSMSITDCDLVEEIVECLEDDAKDGIVFSQLKSLELCGLPKLSSFCTGKCDFEFPSLKKVIVRGCHGLKNLVSYSTAKSLEQLESMSITDCDSVKEIVECLEDNVKDGIVFSQLNSLRLHSLPKLSSICTRKCDFELPSLKQVFVTGCHGLENLVSYTTAKSLKRLETMSITDCDSVKEIVECLEDNVKDGTVFSQLNFLGLHRLPKLSSFCTRKCDFELPSLKEVYVDGCPGLENLVSYTTAKSLKRLERMRIEDCDSVKEIVECLEDNVKDGIVFSQLNFLQLHGLPKLSSFCTRKCDFELPSLKQVFVTGCPQMKYFSMGNTVTKELQNVHYEWEGHGVGDLNSTIQDLFTQKARNRGTFSQGIRRRAYKVGLGYLRFGRLKLSDEFFDLIEIWKKNPEKLTLTFKKLRYLEVRNCSSLSYLLTPSMALSLVQLKDLKVKDCAEMEQVIMVTGVEEALETDVISFPQLESLSLDSCSKLSDFYVGSNTLKLPVLKKITIKDCLKMVRFVSKFLSEKEKETADGRSEETLVKDISIEAFCYVEVEIPILKTLTLSSINIKLIWNNQLSLISSFAQHLAELKVINCSNLKYLFTFSMVKSFVQLKELGISGCEMMEVVILIEGMVKEEQICHTVFPELEVLTLNDLPQLATFCSNCDSLGKIFDSERVNIGTRSQKLLATQLTLVETKATKLVFSQVRDLTLRLLPKFKSFFPQSHITEWPSLKHLVLIECHGAQMVASEFLGIEMTDGDNQLERESQPLLFWISKATFPSLERLAVKWNDNIKIQCGHHPEGYFGKLKVLHLLGFPKQSDFLPPFFFHSLPNLEKLLVKDAFFDEIFQCEEVIGEEKPACGRTPLRTLRLSKLHELTHLWKEDCQLEVDILRNLETLKVQECSRLKNLVPSTVYFDNLQTLVVSECHGLVNLVRYSTAKSLGRLFTMKVANCEMIEEIVVCSGDALKDGIVFTKLYSLQLKGLPRLESFCSGDCNFKFPALREVIVTECPNMQIFSKGELRAPELHKVKLTGDTYEHMDGDIDEDIEKRIDDIFNKDEHKFPPKFPAYQSKKEDEGSWQGNLNSTIQQLFKEKGAGNGKKGNGENSDHDAKEDGGN
ncbi:hypothetical protein SLEP1_g52698 [Rubroshorea leprosula]|uniref:Disease resistance protein At4g27190-like leucine-rich repeats domain-containing protein n=1 Tax=Rubroshorea leprosula TaxID=152421 RepID=A0AAV5M727_9ROSI|nr:hypothetical protein SLEP1_g52698 [Rubroshorea leprosula]